MIGELPPPLLIIGGALLIPFLPGRLRAAYMLLLPVLGFANLWYLEDGAEWSVPLFEQTLDLLRVDRLSTMFGILFHLAAFVAILFSLHIRDRMEQTASVLYVGSALGAVFAGDLVSLFIFWEMLAVSSVFLIWSRRTPESLRAGFRYLAGQITSGLLLFSGVAIKFSLGESLEFSALGLNVTDAWLYLKGQGGSLSAVGNGLIFLAFGVKCAFPFLHNWLVDGYPAGTATGTVFLSGFTTKVAVYSMARCFAGAEELVWIGTAMAVFPIFYAVIENDLRRVLGYSMINQIGFMVVGVGIGTDLALNGAMAHAFNDVFFKGLLFMTMGAVLHRTGTINANELGGLYKSMPLTTGFCIIGAGSISAFPLLSGFVSKSMIMVAAAEEHYNLTWFLLLFAAAGVFHHAGIKIPFFAFFAHDSKKRVKEAPLNMILAMGMAAAMCIFIGCVPTALYSLLPFPNDYKPYDAFHVITQLQLLFFSALAFTGLMLLGQYPPELRSVNLDFDWFFRRGSRAGMWLLRVPLAVAASGFQRLVLERMPSFLAWSTWRRPDFMSLRKVYVIELAVMLVILMLLSFLLFNYLK